jgi:FAD/FMN-containing dehydrogenase
MSTTDTAALLDALRQRLGPEGCVAGADIGPRYFTAYNEAPVCRPLAVLRPASIDDVSCALALCHRFGVGVVPQGGMTGLAGGALAGADEVVLALERFNGIEEIDAAAGTVTVRAGTVLQTLQQAVREVGFELGLDLGARGSCQIGGNLATNAGGNRAIRFGVARDQVLGLEAVLADGTVVGGLNKMLKNNAGYDLKQMFIGSEGTLGVITRAVLRLQPKLHSTHTCLCTVPDYAPVIELWRRTRASLSDVSSFELMWPDFYRYVTAHTPGLEIPFAADEVFYLLIECATTNPDAEVCAARFEACLGEWFEAGLIGDAVLAGSTRQAESLWRLREGLAIDALPNLINYDVSLPIGGIDGFVQQCRATLAGRWPAVQSVFFGHIGDSNLHIGVSLAELPPSGGHEVDALVYALVREAGGSVSAEHGIGRAKRDFLDYTRSPAEIDLMRTLKSALDPRGILNPGKLL